MDKLGFLKSVFGDGKYFSNSRELLVYCPFCDFKNPRFSINIETDMWRCWVCLKKGIGLFYPLKEIKATSSQIDQYAKRYKTKQVNLQQKQVEYKPQLPENYKPLIHENGKLIGKRYLKYLTKRGVSEEQILHYKIGACDNGPFGGRVIFPSFDVNGDLNFFNGRHVDNSNTLPYMNDTKAPKTYKTSVIMNELNLDFTQPLVIVEGWFDLFKATTNTTPLLGSELSAKSLLVQTIVRNKTSVIMATDPDALKTKIIPFMKVLLSFDVPVFCAKIEPWKDLGEMPKEEALSRIKTPTKITEEVLFKMKLERLV
jgi:DNA primase